MKLFEKLPFGKGREAVRQALGLDPKQTDTVVAKPFHQNPDGTLMEMTSDGKITTEQQEVISEENKDLL